MRERTDNSIAPFTHPVAGEDGQNSEPYLMFTFHLIANAHLDPVWLWDGREGLNEGIQTCRTMLDLLDANPDFTFMRGESAIYEHIERFAPDVFERIRAYVAAGRWDVVGGVYVQPDTNLPATETILRQFAVAGRYFESRFGRRPSVGWAADSFGHSAGLPEILASAGMDAFAFTRPFPNVLPLPKPAFWWEAASGARILAYRPAAGWYGSERDEAPRRLDAVLASAQDHGLTNVAVFYGVGNHGGGATQRMLRDIRAWADAHGGDARVVHSGLHRFFGDLRAEVAACPADFLPVHRGELNYALRGCYSALARFKFAYRKAEAAMFRAERTQAFVGADESKSLPWRGLLFNAFHDVLPGTSIERAMDDQCAEVGGILADATRAEFAALNRLAARVDTSVPLPDGDLPSAVPVLIWNPHPAMYRGPLEIEVCLDYRPLFDWDKSRGVEPPVVLRDADGGVVPFQPIRTEHRFGPDLLWRYRVLFDAAIPPFGYAVYTLGYEPGATVNAPPAGSAVGTGDDAIATDRYRVSAPVGADRITITRDSVPLLGAEGLSLVTVADPWGTWGGMAEESESLDLQTVRHTWRVTHTGIRESGPLRAVLAVRLESGGGSRADVTFHLCSGRDAVDVSVRVLWDERGARLKMRLPVGAGAATFDVPGGTATRPAGSGEVPGGRWVSAGNVGFASDALYNFNLGADGTLDATVCRATRYAASDPEHDMDGADPATDIGEHRFRFLLTGSGGGGETEPLRTLAAFLEQPPVALPVWSAPGELPRRGSLAALTPPSATLLAVKPAEDGDGIVLRLQNTAGERIAPMLEWIGQAFQLGEVAPQEIATFRLRANAAVGERCSVTEM